MTARRLLGLLLSAALATAAQAQAPAYSGHGVASVDPAVLARFAPRPIDPPLSRRIQQMLDVRAPDLGRLTTDGRRYFFGWRVTGTRQIWRLDGPDHFPVQLTGGEDATTLFDVTPDGRTLVVQRDRKGEENPGLYLLSADGGALREIQHLPGVQTQADLLSDDGKTLWFHANDRKPDAYTLYAWDLAAGTRTLLLDEPGLWSVADARPDGRLLVTRATGSLSSEWFEWSPKTRALTPLLGQGEQEEYAARYSAAEGELLVQTNKPGEFRRLYRWKAGILTPITPALQWDVSGFSIDTARRRIVYGVNEAGYRRLRALDARTFAALPLPSLPPADHVFGGATTRDGRFTVLGVDLGTGPLASWVYDWKEGKLAPWVVPSTPEVDTRRFVRATLETYPARDGTPIPQL